MLNNGCEYDDCPTKDPVLTPIERAQERVETYQRKLNAARGELQTAIRAAQRTVQVVFREGGRPYTYLVPGDVRIPRAGEQVVVPEPYSWSYNPGPKIATVTLQGPVYNGPLRTLVGRVEEF